MKDKVVLELGSGPGLCGLVSQHYAKTVVFSDYQDLVMDLIKININDAKPRNLQCTMLHTKLDWCRAGENDYYDSLDVKNGHDNNVKTLG